MDRRKFLGYGILNSVGILGLAGCGGDMGQNNNINTSSNTINEDSSSSSFIKLPIPPLAEYKIDDGKKIFNLNIQKGQKNFIEDKITPTFGVNGDFLGPTIKVNNQDNVRVNVKNSLDEETTLHWHGLHINGKYDGGPHQIIPVNESWEAKLKIDQRASTAWYHPHTMERTGYQVYMGIAGLFYIEDENSSKLPNEYGVDDIPLVIQDRRFAYNGNFSYVASMHDRMMGMMGNYILVNGAINPTFSPKKTKTRFRILNGSNSRIYMLGFSDNREFSLVATDGGLVEEPLLMKNLLLAPGERAEIVVDVKNGENIALVDFISKNYLMQIDASETLQNSNPLAKNISESFHIQASENEEIRYFDLSMSMGTALINGKTMDMDRIDEYVPLKRSEVWRVSNTSSMMNMPHPFHVHGCSFEILSRNGKAPYIFERGLKDTVLVNKDEVVFIRVYFKKTADENNPFMYHCHNLEHEDLGMMGQFIVE